MMKLISLILLLVSITSKAKEGKLIEGTPISSDGKDAKLLTNAFSKDLTQELKSKTENGWVGLDLKKANQITRIGWAQKSKDKGVFEGSNKED